MQGEMNMAKKFGFLVLAAMALGACGQTKTQDYYLAHPDELAADLAACKSGGKSTYNCNEADKAAFILNSKKKE
jgi:hypothetical protein